MNRRSSAAVAGGDQLVELGHRGDLSGRDEVAAAEPADLTLDAALLVGALDAGRQKNVSNP